jgi:hypothetical protein
VPVRLAPLLVVVLLIGGCAGTTPFQRCVDHSLQEGVPREQAEQACERAVGRQEG